MENYKDKIHKQEKLIKPRECDSMQTGEPRLRDALNHVWRGLPAKMRELFCCFSCLVVFFSGVMPIISIALAYEGIGTAPKLLPGGYYILMIAVSMCIAGCRLKRLSKEYFSEKKAAHGFQAFYVVAIALDVFFIFCHIGISV